MGKVLALPLFFTLACVSPLVVQGSSSDYEGLGGNLIATGRKTTSRFALRAPFGELPIPEVPPKTKRAEKNSTSRFHGETHRRPFPGVIQPFMSRSGRDDDRDGQAREHANYFEIAKRSRSLDDYKKELANRSVTPETPKEWQRR